MEQAGSWNVSGNRIRDSTGQSPGAVPASVQLSSSASADSDTAVFHFTNNPIYQSKEIRYPRSVGTIVWSRLSGFWLSGPYSSSEQQKQQQQQQQQQQYDWKFEHNQVFGPSLYPVGARLTGQSLKTLTRGLPSDWTRVEGSNILADVAMQGNCGLYGSETDLLWNAANAAGGGGSLSSSLDSLDRLVVGQSGARVNRAKPQQSIAVDTELAYMVEKFGAGSYNIECNAASEAEQLQQLDSCKCPTAPPADGCIVNRLHS